MFLINPYILQASGNPLWDGLQAYYTADNTPNDALGTYNGTLVNGATYGTGIINQGFSFDGINDYVNIGNNFDNNGTVAMSWSCWVKSNDVTNILSLFGKVDATPLGYFLATFSGKTRFYIMVNGSFNFICVENSGTISTATWYNITVTYDGSGLASGLKVYLNASLNTQTVVRDTLSGSTSNTANFTISSRNGANLFYNGIIDEVGIWNRVLTSTEVTELYNAGAGKQYPN